METARNKYLDLIRHMKIVRKRFDQYVQNMHEPPLPILEYLEYIKKFVSAMIVYKNILEIEIIMVGKFTLKILEALVLVYTIHLDEENLPRFFPSFFPSFLEPVDCEKYVEIVQ